MSLIDSSEIKSLWNDPLLRHSNILSGLFHSKVIICEGDSDCRFYSAILHKIFENENKIAPDYLFIHCGGKQRVPLVIKSLRKLNVKINTILDFDVLNDTNPLKDIFEGLGGNWKHIEKDWRIIKEAIDAKRPELETEDFIKELTTVLHSIKEKILPESKIKEIQSLLRKTSAWSHAKQIGKAFIPSGDPTISYNRLIGELNKLGIFVVEIGELESFVKSIGNHGPKWVNDVLSKDIYNDPELKDAIEFVRNLK